MKQKSLFLTACVLTGIGFSATANAAKNSAKMTCEEFIQLDEVARPKVVYWFDGFDSMGKPERIIDFTKNERLVPILVEECIKDPKNLLAKKVKVAEKKTIIN